MKKSYKSKSYIIVFIVGLVLITGYLYWFQWRPTLIRQNCDKSAKLIERDHTVVNTLGREEIDQGQPWFTITKGFDYNTVYDQCLKDKGIK